MTGIEKVYLDKTSPMPLHEQLRKALSEGIISGRIPEGTKLPTEGELCEELGISRTVARQAYSALITDGYVERMRGKGTFVRRYDTRSRFLNMQLSFAKEMSILGIAHRTKMLQQEWITGDVEVALHLGIEEDERSCHIRRMRYIKEKPFVLVENYIPDSIFPGIEQYNLEKYSLYGIFEEHYNIKIKRARRTICARTADSEFAKWFGVPEGFPVLHVINVTFDQYDRPVDYSKEYLNGELEKFEFDVKNQ